MNNLHERAEGYCKHNVPANMKGYCVQTYKDAFREWQFYKKAGLVVFGVVFGIIASVLFFIVIIRFFKC